MPPDPLDDLAARLAVLGFRRAGTEFTAGGRAVRVVGGVAEVLVAGEYWTDAALVSAAIDGIVPTGQSVPTVAAACEAALGAARLPAPRCATCRLDHLHKVEVDWWDKRFDGDPGALVVEVTHNYFDEETYVETWDSILSDRDALWAPEPDAAEAAAFVHALWLAAGGELAPDPVRLGPVALLPMLGDRCEVRVLESADHPKLLGRPWLLDLDVVATLHTTLRHLPQLVG